MWKQDLLQVCERLHIEGLIKSDGKELILVSPKKVEQKDLDLIKKILPEDAIYQVVLGPKQATMMALAVFMKSAGCDPNDIKEDHQSIQVQLRQEVDPEHEIWKNISELLYADGFYESWTFTYDGTVVHYGNRKAIDEARNRKARLTIISKDEISDLTILLESSNSVDDFLARIQ